LQCCHTIFGTRFSTPTDEYGSGTEEEIQEMLEAGKQVIMCFYEMLKDSNSLMLL